MIDVTPLRRNDIAGVSEVWNKTTETLPFSWTPDVDTFHDDVLLIGAEPHVHLHSKVDGLLVAREEERILGFVHCAVGHFADEDKYTSRGFIRFLTTLPSVPTWVTKLLLSSAEEYFQNQGAERISAFHMRTGYPCLLAGRGYFSLDRIDLMGALGDAGYKIRDRWFLYEKTFHTYTMEYLPKQAELSLQIKETAQGLTQLFVIHQGWPVATMSVEFMAELSRHSSMPIATLNELHVEPGYRRKGVARWLFLRVMNELVARGIHRMIVDVNHSDAAAQSLLVQLGFEEVPVRGYSYEKVLAQK